MHTWRRTIVVTGGAGFVGSHLVQRFAADTSVRLVSLDSYATGSQDNHVSADNVVYLEGNTKDIDTHLASYEPDLLCHLGEYARVEQSRDKPGLVWASNLTGTSAVLEYWRRKKMPLLYAGSSTKFATKNIRGEHIEGKNLSPYAWSKAANVDRVRLYGHWYKLPYAVTYFSNIYGPRENSSDEDGTLIAIYLRRYGQGETLKVRDSGDQTRNFTHILDTVDGLARISDGLMSGSLPKREHSNDEAETEFVLAHPTSYSVKQVAAMFPGARIQSEDRDQAHQEANRAATDVDTSSARQIGWQPTRNLPDYIEEQLARQL